jgi:hypothetical protein
MSTEPEEDPPSPETRRAAELALAALSERDDDKARKLIDQSAEAFITAVQARMRAKFAATDVLFAEAERALDASEAAEAAGDLVERDRQKRLFEMLLAAAQSET